MKSSSSLLPAYPGKVAMRRVLEVAQSCGWNTIEVFPDGRIRMIANGDAPLVSDAVNDFDRLEAAGLI